MDARKVKRIITVNAVISITLLASLVAISIFIFNLNDTSLNKIRKINEKTSALNAQNQKGKRKLVDIEKYKKI